MFDEVIETHIATTPEDMENAVADFCRSWNDFNQVSAGITTPAQNQWWVKLEWLALADSRMKDCFCGRDRSPRSIALYHRYRLKMIDGKRYRVDA